MNGETKTVQIRWKGPGVPGRGTRRLGTAEGLSRNYEWQGVGSAIDVTHADAPKIMLLAKTGTMAYVAAPADAEALEQKADAMTAPEDVKAEPKAATVEAEVDPAKKPARTGARRKS